MVFATIRRADAIAITAEIRRDQMKARRQARRDLVPARVRLRIAVQQ